MYQDVYKGGIRIQINTEGNEYETATIQFTLEDISGLNIRRSPKVSLHSMFDMTRLIDLSIRSKQLEYEENIKTIAARLKKEKKHGKKDQKK